MLLLEPALMSVRRSWNIPLCGLSRSLAVRRPEWQSAPQLDGG
jgi:hypothetical protein